ncbi:MAG: hypothetical protein ABJ263_15695 [Tateyamaria sp.]
MSNKLHKRHPRQGHAKPEQGWNICAKDMVPQVFSFCPVQTIADFDEIAKTAVFEQKFRRC